MGSNLEITLFDGKLIRINELIDLLKAKGLNVTIIQTEIFDDWNYKNHIIFNSDIDLSINDQVLEEKIFITRFTIDSRWNCGYSAQKLSENLFEVSGWMDLQDLPFLDNDFISPDNSEIYDKITEGIASILKYGNNSIAAIGVETFINHDLSVEDMINKSHGVVRWIVPEECIAKVFNKYTKIQKYGLVIYDRTI